MSRAEMQTFQNLHVWRKAHQLTLTLYRLTEGFPRSETYGLAAQLRRQSGQIAMKIAEGCGRDHSAEFAVCLGQARGTGVELEYTLLLAHDLDLIPAMSHVALRDQVIEIRRMLSGLMRTAAQPAFDTLTSGIRQGETHGNGSVGAGRD